MPNNKEPMLQDLSWNCSVPLKVLTVSIQINPPEKEQENPQKPVEFSLG
jgi:hypothetical protein